jgi:amino-acid N-acetyltransferase
MKIDVATENDLAEVRRLLERQHLPIDGLDEHVGTMLIARDGAQIVGTAALEVYADGALLRSVAVESGHRARGLGQHLTESALQLAQAYGMRDVFLLTTTAEGFFTRFGFETITRAAVPESVQASIEFRSACPASATVMHKRLAGG